MSVSVPGKDSKSEISVDIGRTRINDIKTKITPRSNMRIHMNFNLDRVELNFLELARSVVVENKERLPKE